MQQILPLFDENVMLSYWKAVLSSCHPVREGWVCVHRKFCIYLLHRAFFELDICDTSQEHGSSIIFQNALSGNASKYQVCKILGYRSTVFSEIHDSKMMMKW